MHAFQVRMHALRVILKVDFGCRKLRNPQVVSDRVFLELQRLSA
jgi:hypothetical protein